MDNVTFQDQMQAAARRGFVNEMAAVQGHEAPIVKKAYRAVSSAGDRRAEKIQTLAGNIRERINSGKQ